MTQQNFTVDYGLQVSGTGGNITGATNIEVTGNMVANVFLGTQANVDLVAGSNTWTFGTNGLLAAPGAISATGNVRGGNINTTGLVTAIGNVYAGNFVGSGAALTSVATQGTGSWTVTTGTNTYSFTVPANAAYAMWVNGNVPNGIILWNATVTISNTNVPVLGQQFAWYYLAGNNLVWTSIPDQIIGTAGSISNTAPAVSNTNVFTFGITNNSGSSQTVNYGWTKIS